MLEKMTAFIGSIISITTVSLVFLANISPLVAFSSSQLRPPARLTSLLSTKQRNFELTSDKGVLKEVITPGQGRRIEAGDILAIEYAASVKGSKTPFAKGNKEQFIVKDGSLIKGWDIAIESMRIGEVSKVSISNSYAYGAKGVSPVIPPGKSTYSRIHTFGCLVCTLGRAAIGHMQPKEPLLLLPLFKN